MTNIETKRSEEIFLQFLTSHLTLSAKEQQSLLALPIFKTFPKGTTLFKEGDFTKEYYLVIKGGIRTYLLVDGDEITTEFYTETDSLIPASTASNRPSNSYATCFEDSMVVVSTKDVEKKVVKDIPAFASLCRKFSENILAEKQQAHDDYRTLTPEQRYLQLIEERPGLIQRIPQYHLASYLGVRPESLSRIRKRLTQK